MKFFKIFILILVITAVIIRCSKDNSATNQIKQADFSGSYCIDALNSDMVIVQSGKNVTFTIQSEVVLDGAGIISGDTLLLTAAIADSQVFSCTLIFTQDRTSFSGSYQVTQGSGTITSEGLLQGSEGECAKYDIVARGNPRFVTHDFTQVSKIEKISKFRSDVGHSYTDNFETCRSMKHYYSAFEKFRKNKTIEIYSPVNGIIISVSNDGHGASIGLNNKQIQIRPDVELAFKFRLFHCDLLSSDIATGKKVQAGELLGYARLYYEDLHEYADSFDIAVWVNTPSGLRLVPYFETMQDKVFNSYNSRGVHSRQDFIITKEARDADPLQCNGETFLNSGTLDNWVVLD